MWEDVCFRVPFLKQAGFFLLTVSLQITNPISNARRTNLSYAIKMSILTKYKLKITIMFSITDN